MLLLKDVCVELGIPENDLHDVPAVNMQKPTLKDFKVASRYAGQKKLIKLYEHIQKICSQAQADSLEAAFINGLTLYNHFDLLQEKLDQCLKMSTARSFATLHKDEIDAIKKQFQKVLAILMLSAHHNQLELFKNAIQVIKKCFKYWDRTPLIGSCHWLKDLDSYYLKCQKVIYKILFDSVMANNESIVKTIFSQFDFEGGLRADNIVEQMGHYRQRLTGGWFMYPQGSLIRLLRMAVSANQVEIAEHFLRSTRVSFYFMSDPLFLKAMQQIFKMDHYNSMQALLVEYVIFDRILHVRSSSDYNDFRSYYPFLSRGHIADYIELLNIEHRLRIDEKQKALLITAIRQQIYNYLELLDNDDSENSSDDFKAKLAHYKHIKPCFGSAKYALEFYVKNNFDDVLPEVEPSASPTASSASPLAASSRSASVDSKSSVPPIYLMPSATSATFFADKAPRSSGKAAKLILSLAVIEEGDEDKYNENKNNEAKDDEEDSDYVDIGLQDVDLKECESDSENETKKMRFAR